ncbi:MAG: TonB-dependent receptor [Bacteroidales bacterium]|nr:TonB-dependent receptor [Bacteroidales bacterium]
MLKNYSHYFKRPFLSGFKGLIFVLFFTLFSSLSPLKGQPPAKYSIEFKNLSIEASVKKMQAQFGMNFFYDSESLRTEKKIVNKSFKNNTLVEILDSVFEGTNFTYSIVNNVITIARKESKTGDQISPPENNLVTIKGLITDKSGIPIEMAMVSIPDLNLWGTSDSKGLFNISKVSRGKLKIQISCLGYSILDTAVIVSKDVEDIFFKLEEENLKLKSVIVAAKENKDALNTSLNIDRQAIDHLQVISPTDIMSLLPGGKTVNTNLFYNYENVFNIRGGDGNGSFGTAVEVDGVRLSSNNILSTTSGVNTRYLSTSNLESIEVVAGIPSVEYGDMSSGLVRIKTKKGRTPYSFSVSLNPTTKQLAFNKGFDLLNERGILNLNAEYTHAFQNPVTPYRTYFRNGYGVNYMNTFNRNKQPIFFNISLNGTLGRLDTKKDPDAYDNTWASAANNSLLFGASANWLINSKYITSLDFSVNASYTDDIQKENEYYSYATIRPSINATENGYYETNYLPVQFFNLKIVDSKGFNFRANIKASLNRKYGSLLNKFKLGIGWRSDGNVGKGEYYEDNIYPDGYRPRPYSDIPFLHNWNTYLEDNITIPAGKTSLSLVGGVRIEGNIIKEMNYKNVVSASPRFNARYTIINKKDRDSFINNLSVRAGWGIMEKLPSLSVLYPTDKYSDIRIYSKNYGTENKYFYAAKTNVFRDYFNPDLKWSRSRNIEAGIDAIIAGVGISLVYYNNKSVSPYITETSYLPYSYSKTNENYTVPDNPEFRVDKVTGDIYVKDLDNPSSGENLIPKSVTDTLFIAKGMQSNDDPSTRQGVELILDFGKIESINTSFRFDASYSYSKSVFERLKESYPASRHSTLPTNLGRSYEYVAYYLAGTGSYQTYNGSWEDGLNANITATTHIPDIRLTISLRLEGSLFSRSQNLTYYNGKEWAFLIDGDGNKVNKSVYNQKEYYSGVWPVAYKGFDGIVHPFTEAEAQDPRFAPMIGQESDVYTYVKDGSSAFFMANLNFTKEIGDLASISFYANNFARSNPYIKSWATGVKTARNISFSYGATLRIKF